MRSECATLEHHSTETTNDILKEIVEDMKSMLADLEKHGAKPGKVPWVEGAKEEASEVRGQHLRNANLLGIHATAWMAGHDTRAIMESPEGQGATHGIHGNATGVGRE